ncbi:aconitate hydratase [Boothiomyces macroporosus]|uniref:Aconitate hydratase, mitochondrial n=1 Tax=Boothiomyces macroporosus TaxID=261099 RepID=A0AAD5URY8_9FUNG|nr:aconitate hydratase [Boothiomyces macroporosus]
MPPRGFKIPNYNSLINNLNHVWKPIGKKPLTLAEKILYAHLDSPLESQPTRGTTYLKLNPGYIELTLDRVAMQDASAQTALLQFILSKKKTTAVPSSVHCDHLIAAQVGADSDLKQSIISNKEVFNFLQTTSKKYGIDFWAPGSGIIHQIVLENYAAPGILLLGTDSHTPNAGGLGMIAIGVGGEGADAVDAMAGIPWELKAPKILGVRLTGKLNGWTNPKDVILHLAGKLTVQGGTNHIIEYFGPGVDSLSCTGMATICNMGAEVGATTSLFPFTDSMKRYLNATRREDAAEAAAKAASMGYLQADKGAEYDKVIEINLSELEPHINGPFTPDLSWPLSKFKDAVKENNWPTELSAGLIGSCTNSSYQDMCNAAEIAKQASEKGIKAKANFFVTPGSEQIRATIERDGIISTLESVGGVVLANACGPCIGQWKRDFDGTKENAILTSFNRNFKARNDGSAKTMNFLASPEIVTAMTFSGRTDFNPITDSLKDINGNEFKLKPPKSDDLPSSGFLEGRPAFGFPISSEPDESIEITISKESDRLQLLESFEPWDGKEFENLQLLVKAEGKCTTDHISAAGVWLKYKGHLENISKNTLIGATNAFHGKVNVARNAITNELDTIPNVGFDYRAKGVSSAIIGDWNYGEGSAREHAAMQPRYLGCKIVITRSFARIHETNLKKQGILPLTFKNEKDYDLIPEICTLSTRGVVGISPNSPVFLTVKTPEKEFEIELKHTMSEDQIAWFKAGSALNMIANNA